MAADTYEDAQREGGAIVVVEPWAGGRIYRGRCPTAPRARWGHDPWRGNRRTASCWRGSRTCTEQPTDRARDPRSSPRTTGGTRVDLEHRGWERLGALAAEARSGYGENWTGVLALFADLAGQLREDG